MFWIQNYGNAQSRNGYRMFYAEKESDIQNLPTNTREGKQDAGETSANEKCAVGSECFCIENKKAYFLKTDGWG